ncbi:MAG TPA: diguanylate cyclase [Rudaea sp.]|jgi:diguanylate cyclase (GGDEF)-like protein
MDLQRQSGLVRLACRFAAAGWLGLVCGTPAWALNPAERFHDYVRDNWNSENGLPQVSVLTITQDATGYIWIGTQNAIARFDGVRFTVFDRRNTGIDTTMATVSYTDRRGHPWFGTAHGALRYADGTFAAFRAGSGNAAVQGIAESDDGTLLFATSLGVMRLHGNALEPVLLEGERSCSLLRDGGDLWVGQTGQLSRIDNGGVTRYSLPAQARNACISRLSRTRSGLWLGTTSGLFRLRDGHIEPGGLDPRLDRQTTESLFRDSSDNLWIGTAAILYRLRPGGELERIGEDDFVRDSWILGAFEDREGNLWLGSQTEGLFRLWDGWVQRVSRRDGLSDAFVWSVAKDPHGGIVFGTNSNVAAWSADDGARQLISGSQLPNPSAYDLFYDSAARLWVGTRAGVVIYSGGKLSRPPALVSLDPYQINTIVEDGNDFWIGTSGGLYRYRGSQLDRVGAAPGVGSARIRSLYLQAPGELLVGTESGMRLVRGDLMTTPGWAAAFESRMISHIGLVRDGLIAATTLDSGLGLISGERMLVLTTDQGLPSDNAWTFHTIDDQLYVAGIDGVWRLPLGALPDPSSAAPVLAGSPQMVLSASGRERGSQRIRCCNGGAQARSVVDDAGGIWFTSISGALRLDARAITYAQRHPTVVIEGLRHGSRWHGQVPAQLRLDSSSRDIEIDFTGLSFRDPNSLRFHYRLDGYDSDWIDAGARRSAFYTNLPPGNYRFRVEASLPNTDFGADAAALAFDLAPRWYERASVRAALAVLALCLIGVLVRLRLHRYSAAQEKLEGLVSERTLALSRANERLRQANQVLAFESQTDPLTGLHNRRFLLDHAGALFDPEQAGSAALLLLDLDHFKQVNDRHGHAAGDDVLIQLARLLQHLAREGDHVLRWGGEEFLLVVKSVRAEQALEIAERLRLAISKHAFSAAATRTLHMTCSIGVSVHPLWPAERHVADWSLTLELADAALYRVKQDGRNGSMGLVAGPTLAEINLASRDAGTVDALVADSALNWLHPVGAAQLRIVH